MKMPPAVIEMFLRSSGAPPAVLDLFKLIQAEGFSAFRLMPAKPDDPTWTLIESDPTRSQVGFWGRAAGPTSRITVGVFLEGVNDEVVSKLASVGGVRLAPVPESSESKR